MRNLLTIIALSLTLNGCIAAAPLILTAAGAALSGYSLYNIGTVRNARYEVPDSPVGNTELASLKSARTLAVFPTQLPSEGAVVDIFNQRSDFKTISSRTTINVAEQQNITHAKIKSYPAQEWGGDMQRFGQAAGADVVVFADVVGTRTSNGLGVMVGKLDAIMTINCKIYSVDTGALLLDENHTLTIDGKTAPTDGDLQKVAATGIADRLYHLRTGQKREQPKKRNRSSLLDTIDPSTSAVIEL